MVNAPFEFLSLYWTLTIEKNTNYNNCYKILQDGGFNKERDNLWFRTLQLKFIFYLKRLKVKRSDGTADIRSLPAAHNTEIIQYLPTVIPSKGWNQQDKKLLDSLKLF